MYTLSDLRQRPHLSVSQIKTFLTCPRRYYFAYVERIPPAFRSIALSFGTAWHVAIGELLTTDPGVEEVTGIFCDVLEHDVLHGDVPVLFEDDEDLRSCIALGTKMVAEFRRSVPMPDEVIGLEMPFSIDLHDPFTEEVLERPLVGAMDAIVVECSKPVIWELKSGKKQWTETQLEFDLQPAAYVMGARSLGVDALVKVIVTTKTKEPTVQSTRVRRTERDERELSHVAASVLRAVKAGVDHPVRDWWCKSCPYAGRCM
jgi:putative RecB family exonuclease